jgi:ribosomal protein S18 acetylase RimI-like enzyme
LRFGQISILPWIAGCWGEFAIRNTIEKSRGRFTMLKMISPAGESAMKAQPAKRAEVTVQLTAPGPEHVSELGRICYEAFKDIHDRHRFPPDFPSVALARRVIGMLVQRQDCYGVAALIDGQPVGSNFLSLTDAVAGVGPITVDCSFQGMDIGRMLMQDVIDYAKRNNIERVRLLQDGFNMASLSLYTSLGFDVKDPVALMQAAPAPQPDDHIREVTDRDLPAIEELSKRIYKANRRNEVAAAIQHGFSPMLREREGRITGYLIPGLLGHGVAETEQDAVALTGEAARRLPPEAARFFCPLREAEFYRGALKAGCRAIKVMNLMAMGPYDPPGRVWMPSVLY